MNNTSSTDRWEFTKKEYLVIGIFMTVNCIIAIAGNVSVLIVFWKNQSLKKPFNCFILNLTLSDLIVSSVAYPMTAYSAFNMRWEFGSSGCSAYAFICFTCSVNSIMTHAAISFFRYTTMYRCGINRKLTFKQTIQTLVAIWIYSLFWTVSPLIGWSSYVTEHLMISCSMKWHGRDIADISFVWLSVIFVYILPLSIMIYSYTLIVIKTNTSPAELETRNWRYTNTVTRNIENHVTLVCFITTVAFVVAWTPYAVITILSSVDVEIKGVVGALPTLFAKVSCLYNPIIYCFTNAKFRETLYKILLPCHYRRVGIHFLDVPSVTYTVRQVNVDESDVRFANDSMFLGNVSRDQAEPVVCVYIPTRQQHNSLPRMVPREPVIQRRRQHSIDFSII